MKNPFTKKTMAALVVLLALGAVGWVGQSVVEGNDAQTTTSTFDVEGTTLVDTVAKADVLKSLSPNTILVRIVHHRWVSVSARDGQHQNLALLKLGTFVLE